MIAAYVDANRGSLCNKRGDWLHLSCPECGDTKKHLGVNVRTGHIVCLRCGVSSQATWVDKSCVFKLVSRDTPPLHQYYVSLSDSVSDMDVASYIISRGIDIHDRQVGFGRGDAANCAVFIQYDENTEPNYIQWRSIKEKQYMSVSGTSPRLNHYGKKKVEGDVLVLTEGPVDAIRVRVATGLWSSPLCSTRFDANYVIDIVQAQPKLVIIMLDNDAAGRAAVERTYSKLGPMGIDFRVVIYPDVFSPKDAGEMTDSEIIDLVSNTLSRR